MKITRNLKEQIKSFINQGESLVSIINYLFTCDYTAIEIVKILVTYFDCKEQLIRDVLEVNFGIEFSPFTNLI